MIDSWLVRSRHTLPFIVQGLFDGPDLGPGGRRLFWHCGFADFRFRRSGPMAVVGWLSCLGNCDATGITVYQRCEEEKHKVRTRATRGRSSDPCLNLMDWAFECPAWQQGLLNSHSCPGTQAAGDAGDGSDVGGKGDGVIHF